MIDSMSRWLVGSSISRTSGSPSSTRAIATRIFQPPDSAPDIPVNPLIVEPETVENFAGAALERVAAEMVVFVLHVAKARENAVHVVDLRRVGHRVLQLLELVVQLAEAAAAGDGLVEHGAARHLFDVLAEIADRELARDRHVAFVGLFLAGDHPEEGGLARAVGTDQSDLLARIELERGVDEQHLSAVLLADGGKRNHGVSVTLSSAPYSIVRSLSRAAHFSSVSRLFCTRPSNTVLPSAMTVTGFGEVEHVGREQQRERGHASRRRAHRVALARRSTRPVGPVGGEKRRHPRHHRAAGRCRSDRPAGCRATRRSAASCPAS